jgi:hypothetical protein
MMHSETWAMKIKAAIWSGLSVASILMSAGALAQTIPGNTDGIEIPKYGDNELIEGSYIANDGHLVIKFAYNDQGKSKVDFYDTRTRQRLFPDQAKELAHDNRLVARLPYSAGLAEIGDGGPAYLTNDITVREEGSSTKICEWPYSTSLVIDAPGKKPIRKTIAVRRDQPKTQRHARYCGGGDETLTTRYDVPSPIEIFSDGRDGFFAQPFGSRYLIHFDRDLNSEFFKGRDDIVLVKPDALESIINEVTRSPLPEQMFIEKLDGVLDNAGQTQKAAR